MKTIEGFFQKVSHFGVKEEMPLYVQKSTILFNQICRVLFFFMIIGSTFVYIILDAPQISVITLGMAFCVLISLVLNYFSKIHLSIIIISVVLPVFLLTSTIYIKTLGLFHSALLFFIPRFLIMVFTFMSVVFNAFQKPVKALIVSSVGFLCFFLYDFFHEIFGVSFHTMPFISDHYKVFISGFCAIFIFTIVLIIFLQKINIRYEQVVLSQKKDIEDQRDEISTQRDEIEAQRDMVLMQKKRIEEIHREVSESIDYATKIQTSILPDESILKKYFSDNFVLFKPKDKVSGDFYWWTKVEGYLVITVADCTGHGVPGAFMSMLGVSFLREIVVKEYIVNPDVILRKLRKEIIHTLKQKGESGEQKDGMDMALISINTETLEMQFAGANNPCYIIKQFENLPAARQGLPMNQFGNDKLTELASGEQLPNFQINAFPNFVEPVIELVEIKGDKMPLGIYENMKPFTSHKIQLSKGDVIYMTSDGYEDQFGGENNKKFLSKNMKQLIKVNSQQPMSIQKDLLEKAHYEWKGNNEQTDDITVMGIKI